MACRSVRAPAAAINRSRKAIHFCNSFSEVIDDSRSYETGLFSGSYRIGDIVDALKEFMATDGSQ